MIQGESEREEKREKARERVGGKRERKGVGLKRERHTDLCVGVTVNR